MAIVGLIISGLVSLLTFFIGLKSFLSKPRDRINRTFFFLLAVGALWSINGALRSYFLANGQVVIILTRAFFFLGPAGVAGFFRFSLYFPDNKLKLNPILEILLFLPLILLILTGVSGNMIYNERIIDGKYLRDYYFAYKLMNYAFISYLIASIAIIVTKFFKTTSKFDKLKIKWISFGLTVTILGVAIFTILLPLLTGNADYWIIGSLFIIPATFAIYYSIAKHRLMDISLIIKKSLIYSLVVLFVSLFYSVVIAVFPKYLGIKINTFGIILSSFIIVLGLKPLELLISKATDKIFFRAGIDFNELLRKITSKIAMLTELELLAKEMNSIFINDFKIKKSSFYLCDKEGKFIKEIGENKSSIYTIKSSVWNYFSKQKFAKLVVFEELVNETRTASANEKHLYELMIQEMKQEDSVVLLPLVVKDNALAGFVSLGGKKSDDPYFSSDLKALELINANMSLGVERIHSIKEEKEMAIKYAQAKEQEKHLQKEMELERKLEQSRKMESIGTLAGGVAHDLNNILSGLVGYPDMLLLDITEDDPMRETVITIKNAGEKAASVVQDLLTLTRRGGLTLEKNDINAIIKEATTSLEFKELQKKYPNIKFVTSLNSNLKEIMMAGYQVSKSLHNVLKNAFESIVKDSGLVELTSEAIQISNHDSDELEPGEYICISVKDNGAGILQEDKKKIFEPFFTTKKMGTASGTGLGLAVLWGTIKDHNGHVIVNSEVNLGTTFKLYFPVADGRNEGAITKVAG